ncbi:MAG: 4Fe-4S binding protein [Solobacterium sp.]|nr:4Fe-4S binding protein [Solobacterium sp.]MCH4205037.1 4Fe-4S binding protein [Solobacterium sp.]MCH4226546.1 4Fe-4S binding protein [Solobacterium sp.]MCH4281830.1 4Fe-4S binding protein [Solobacterium sp.]
MSKSVIAYTLEHCVRCMKCLHACPTGAISMADNRIHIDKQDCINCGRCVRACHSKGMVSHGSTLEDIKNYDYTVCIVPTGLFSRCQSAQDAEELFYAIKQLGFDEVVDHTDIDAQLAKEASLISESAKDFNFIESFCPVVNELISKKYSILGENVLQLQYPSEICAKQIRRRVKSDHLGIFNLCECEANLALAKYPYGNDMYEVDHALSLTDLFPRIRENLHKGREPVALCVEGLQTCAVQSRIQKADVLVADGFEKISEILDESEFGILNQYHLLSLYSCYNGCIGGHLLWGSTYLVNEFIDKLKDVPKKTPSELPFDELFSDAYLKNEDTRTFAEKMNAFQKVNAILEELPGYDCGACGKQTCRSMAEEIVNGNRSLKSCRILNKGAEE